MTMLLVRPNFVVAFVLCMWYNLLRLILLRRDVIWLPSYDNLDAVTYESMYQQIALNQTLSLIAVIAVSSLVIFSILFGILTCARSSRIYIGACRMRDEHAIKLAGRAMTMSIISLLLLNLPLVFISASMVKAFHRTEWSSEQTEEDSEE